MTIQEIVKLVQWKEVERALKFYYPKDKNKYEPVFKKLQAIPAKKHSRRDEMIQIIAQFDEEEKHGYYNIETNMYSCSFRKWAELANIPIDVKVLQHMHYEGIVAHFIWEITFYGTEADAAKAMQETNKRMKQVKQSKEYKDAVKASKNK